MATRIVLRNGHTEEVEEALEFVVEAMEKSDTVIVKMHAANGSHGWEEAESPVLYVRGSEIALAYPVMDLPKPTPWRRRSD